MLHLDSMAVFLQPEENLILKEPEEGVPIKGDVRDDVVAGGVIGGIADEFEQIAGPGKAPAGLREGGAFHINQIRLSDRHCFALCGLPDGPVLCSQGPG